uniref:Pyrimidine 5-nucleotidase n=1 Tax=Kalanchoe fedtschenkoi TaxID=63787 RepID=A0A7N1A603_KALFE
MAFPAPSSPFDCLVFDLDDTLYPSTTGIAAALKKNIDDFLIERFGFAATEASNLRVQLFRTYGSSLAGLRALGYNIDADDYHSFVHGRLPYDAISPNPHLRNLLQTISQRKIVFTNSDRKHAVKVLERLGLQDCFERIICFETMNPNLSKSTRPDEYPILLKPAPAAIKIAVDVADLDPSRTLFLDDNVKNIAAGKALGLRTALIGEATRIEEADYAMEKITQLSKMVPGIWAEETNGGDEKMGREMNAIRSATTKVGA